MKTYNLIITRQDGRIDTRIGTLEELNRSFGKNAKSIKTFLNQIRKSYNEREAACYRRTSFEIA
jgi:cellulose biosynthesis protein BcsQ